MDGVITVRPARSTEIAALAQRVAQRLPDVMAHLGRRERLEGHLSSLIPDQCLYVATMDNQLAGMGAVDLDHARLLALFVDPDIASGKTAPRLLAALENHALKFGVRHLGGAARKNSARLLESLGYRCQPFPGHPEKMVVGRSLVDQASAETRRIMQICDELEIPQSYGAKRRLPIVPEAREREYIGDDLFGRPQYLLTEAGLALKRMIQAAQRNGVEILLVSAYRSIAYQANLVRRKLQQGQSMDEVLAVSAAPGYSEHHSARAVDLTTRGIRPLEEEFAHTDAYQWLLGNAAAFGFRESFQAHNRHGIAWEPWHWYYHR